MFKNSTRRDKAAAIAHHPVDGDRPSVKQWVATVLCAASLSVLFVYISRQYTHQPSLYTVCSRDGNNVYTVDAENSKVQCITIRKNRVTATGSLDDVRAWVRAKFPGADPAVRYIPEGAIVVPGMSDSHVHAMEYGRNNDLVLEGTKDIDETVQRVRDYVLKNPDIFNDTDAFIYGGGWDKTAWPTDTFPTTAQLEADDVLRGRKIALQSKDMHAFWVSQAVVDNATIPESIEGGVIVRYPDGTPTGIFIDKAREFLYLPVPGEASLIRHLDITARDALSVGLTSIHDAGAYPASLPFFKRRADQGKLPIRIYAMHFFNQTGDYDGKTVQPIINAGDGRLNSRSFKFICDGSLRAGGAALFEPYTDDESTTGFMRLSPEALNASIPKYLADGWQTNIHAIGDRTNSVVLDVLEYALQNLNANALRPRIEHAQIIRKSDAERLGKLGVIASIQPTHAISDMWYAEDRLGPERIKMLYAFRNIMDGGARIALGSDFPVETMNPLHGFYAAITRLSFDGRSPKGPEGWFPEQSLTREEALRGMTIDPAYASFTEDVLGSLEVGKKADLVILSHDIMKIEPKQILDTTVLATILDGQVVFGEL